MRDQTAALASPVYDAGARSLVALGANVRVEHDWRGHERAIWDGVDTVPLTHISTTRG